jgi:hypothetical protein
MGVENVLKVTEHNDLIIFVLNLNYLLNLIHTWYSLVNYGSVLFSF